MKEISKFMIVISLTIVVMLSVQSITGQAINKTVFTSHGTLQTIGVNAFLDSACTNPVTSLDWGTLQPGNTINKSFYLLNQGNTPVVLQLYAENWNSYSAEQNLVLSWNYGSQSLSPQWNDIRNFDVVCISKHSGRDWLQFRRSNCCVLISEAFEGSNVKSGDLIPHFHFIIVSFFQMQRNRCHKKLYFWIM